MSFSGAAFEKNFSVTAKPAGDSSMQRTVSIKDRLGGGSGSSVTFASTPPETRPSVLDRLGGGGGGGGGGGPPRGGQRFSDHDDRTARMPYNDYDRPGGGGSYRFAIDPVEM